MKLLHQIGPWVLLFGGIVGLLLNGVLYRATQRWGQKFLNSGWGMEWVERHGQVVVLVYSALSRFAERSLKSSFWRWLSVFQSLAYIVGSIVWFVLRP